MPQLLARFQQGEVIASTDPALVALHTTATAHRGQLIAAANVSPGKLPTGTLRALLEVCGWQLQKVGRIKARGNARDTYTYTAAPVALPEGVEPEALAAAWLAELQEQARERHRKAAAEAAQNRQRDESGRLQAAVPVRQPGQPPAAVLIEQSAKQAASEQQRPAPRHERRAAAQAAKLVGGSASGVEKAMRVKREAPICTGAICP